MSPLEYVHTLRLEEAKQMLESGTASIEGIQRGGLRRCRVLQPAVPAQREPYAGTVPEGLRIDAQRAGRAVTGLDAGREFHYSGSATTGQHCLETESEIFTPINTLFPCSHINL